MVVMAESKAQVHSPQLEHMAVDEHQSGEVDMEVSPTPLRRNSLCYDANRFIYYIPLSVSDSELHGSILEAIQMEQKYLPALSLASMPRDPFEISARMRNGSCHVLRCLRVWYELPSDTFFLAVNIMDRFLTRMRAQPKHLSCIAVASFSVAAREISERLGVECPSRETISVISQSKCTSNDVSRMEDIISKKLDFPQKNNWYDNSLPVTAIHLMKLLYTAYWQLLSRYSSSPCLPPLLSLIYRLEMVLCDTRAANIRPSILVLAVLKTQVNGGQFNDVALSCLNQILIACNTSLSSLKQVESLLQLILHSYDYPITSEDSPRNEDSYFKQRLVWKLSNRTLRQLRPTNKLRKYSRMSTLREFQTEEAEEEQYFNEKALQEEFEEETDEEEMDTEDNPEEMMEEETEKKEETMERSYSQAAKKKAEEKSAVVLHRSSNKYIDYRLPRADKMLTYSPPPYSTTIKIQSSPLSKLTLTHELPKLNSAKQNLTRLLLNEPDEYYEEPDCLEVETYGYHYGSLITVLEGVDGDILTAQLSGGKRKKSKVKLGLSTQILYDNSKESSTSPVDELEDPDYEKDFPPLPVPRSPLLSRFPRSPPTSGGRVVSVGTSRQRRPTPHTKVDIAQTVVCKSVANSQISSIVDTPIPSGRCSSSNKNKKKQSISPNNLKKSKKGASDAVKSYRAKKKMHKRTKKRIHH